MRKMKTITREYETPMALCALAAVLRRIQAEIPDAELDEAEVEVGDDSGVNITYSRPETDAEMQQREEQEAAAARAREAHERATLAELKAKYEG